MCQEQKVFHSASWSLFYKMMSFITSIWVEIISKHEDSFSDVSHQFWICFFRRRFLQLTVQQSFVAHEKRLWYRWWMKVILYWEASWLLSSLLQVWQADNQIYDQVKWLQIRVQWVIWERSSWQCCQAHARIWDLSEQQSELNQLSLQTACHE